MFFFEEGFILALELMLPVQRDPELCFGQISPKIVNKFN
jgi:hypothetical protein